MSKLANRTETDFGGGGGPPRFVMYAGFAQTRVQPRTGGYTYAAEVCGSSFKAPFSVAPRQNLIVPDSQLSRRGMLRPPSGRGGAGVHYPSSSGCRYGDIPFFSSLMGSTLPLPPLQALCGAGVDLATLPEREEDEKEHCDTAAALEVSVPEAPASVRSSRVGTHTPCLSDNRSMVTRFATSPPTDNCPQPKEAQPLPRLTSV